MLEPLYVCAFRAHQSCFNTRSQTLNKEYDNTTKYNQTIQTVLSFFCSAFQAPRWPPVSSDAPRWMSPHRHSLSKCLLFGCIYYLSTRAYWMKNGVKLGGRGHNWPQYSGLSEVWCIYDQVLLYSRFAYVAGLFLKHRRDEKIIIISFPLKVLCSHFTRWFLMRLQHRASCENIFIFFSLTLALWGLLVRVIQIWFTNSWRKWLISLWWMSAVCEIWSLV